MPGPVTHSINEIEALATKAARGSGAHAAQAAAFGKATAKHLAAKRPEQDLHAALAALPEGPIQTYAFAPDSTTALGQSYTDDTPLPQRVTPSPALLKDLADRAHNTYVPSTEESRTGGAGAGLTNND